MPWGSGSEVSYGIVVGRASQLLAAADLTMSIYGRFGAWKEGVDPGLRYTMARITPPSTRSAAPVVAEAWALQT